jgi:uncharacterized protein YndB with AHSA1/START domain
MRDSVTVHMNAPAGLIWDLVSDVTRIGEYSPETFEAEWMDGATQPAVGARFRGHVKRNGRGPVYWTNCRILEAEPGRSFGFVVEGPKGKPVNTWRYELRADGSGTDVTESFELADALPFKIYWTLMGRWRGRTNRTGMQTTLERIKAVAEAETPLI